MAEEELPSYTPQHLHDILPIYADPTNPLESFTLTQTSPATQTLRLQSQDPDAIDNATTYHVKTFATGGFMNKKPHVVITKSSPLNQQDGHPPPPPRRRSLFSRSPSPPSKTSISQNGMPAQSSIPCAEARFDIHGTGTSISYLSPPASTSAPTNGGEKSSSNFSGNNNTSTSPRVPQRLELSNSAMQILRTTIGRQVFYWQEHPGNRSVYDLVDESEEVRARFVYVNIPWLGGGIGGPGGNGVGGAGEAASAPSAPPPHPDAEPVVASTAASAGEGTTKDKDKDKERKKSTAGTGGGDFEVGRLEVVGGKVLSEAEREELLCSALVVIERAKRRAINLGLVATGPAGQIGVGDLGGPRIRGYS